MTLPGRVNFRCQVTSPARRDDALRQLPAVLDGSGIAFHVDDGELGRLGLPRWTTVWFHAEHGDYDRLQSDVVQRLRDTGLSGIVEELPTP